MPRQGVQYVQSDEPSFIKQFKQRIGHKDAPDVDTKRNIPNFDDDGEDDDAPEREDEKPVVVVVKSGDLTAEEADVEQKQIDEGPARLEEKIKFKKPVKRTKDAEEDDKGSEEVKKKKSSTKDKTSDSKKAKNTSLLSFGDDEEEDET